MWGSIMVRVFSSPLLGWRKVYSAGGLCSSWLGGSQTSGGSSRLLCAGSSSPRIVGCGSRTSCATSGRRRMCPAISTHFGILRLILLGSARMKSWIFSARNWRMNWSQKFIRPIQRPWKLLPRLRWMFTMKSMVLVYASGFCMVAVPDPSRWMSEMSRGGAHYRSKSFTDKKRRKSQGETDPACYAKITCSGKGCWLWKHSASIESVVVTVAENALVSESELEN